MSMIQTKSEYAKYMSVLHLGLISVSGPEYVLKNCSNNSYIVFASAKFQANEKKPKVSLIE